MEALTSSIEYKQELNRGKDNKKCWNFQNIFEIPRIIVSLQRLDKSRGFMPGWEVREIAFSEALS